MFHSFLTIVLSKNRMRFPETGNPDFPFRKIRIPGKNGEDTPRGFPTEHLGAFELTGFDEVFVDGGEKSETTSRSPS